MHLIDSGVAEAAALQRPSSPRLAAGAARAAGVAMLAGMIGGIVWGVGARAAMRAIVLTSHQLPQFSLGGTLMILLVGVFIGVPVGLAFLPVRRFVPGPLWRRGLVFGAVVLAVLGTLLYRSGFQEEAPDARALPLAIGLFGTLFVLLGAVVAWAYGELDRRLLRPGQSRLATILGALLLCLPPVVEAGLIWLMVFGGLE
jgi:hypothetical protein